MQTDIASTVLSVRIQFLRRCLRTRGANFISGSQHSFLQVPLRVGARGGPRIVRHHHDRLAEFLVERLHQVENLFRALAVEVTSRLVGHQHRRVGHDGARDGDTLFLSA